MSSNRFLVLLDLNAIIATEAGRLAYGSWLRNEITGNELAARLNANVRDTQNGIQGLLTAAKLQTKGEAGLCGAILEIGEAELLEAAALRLESMTL